MNHIEDLSSSVGGTETHGASDKAPEQPSDIPRVPRNRAETDIAIGKQRMEILLPYVMARLGRPLVVGGTSPGIQPAEGTSRRRLSLSADAKELSRRLGCGCDFLARCVNLMIQKGPENVRASELLKRAPSGGRDQLKIKKSVRRVLIEATEKVCVEQGMIPGRRRTTDAIIQAMKRAGISDEDMPCRETIRWPGLTPHFVNERAARIQGEHMLRVIKNVDDFRAINGCVQMDGTTFTSNDNSEDVIYAVGEHGRELGIVNAIFGLDVTTRYPWTALPVVGAINSYLVGLAVHRGLIAKDRLFASYNIKGKLKLHGKPGAIQTDCGPEFIGQHTQRVLDDLNVGFSDICPPYTPHFRAPGERFNRTAHTLFAEFVRSPIGRKYQRPVPGKSKCVGVNFKDLDRAMLEWLATDYVERAHAGLGGSSPSERYEDYAQGRSPFPLCGYPVPMAENPHLMWDFLAEEKRVIKHTGIHLFNRCYRDARLTSFFSPGRRASAGRVAVRYNPYGLQYVYLRVESADGNVEIMAIPWVRETDRLPMSEDVAATAVNPSLWEWEAIYQTLRRAGHAKPTAIQAEILAEQREQSAGAPCASGAPKKRERAADRSKRAMRKFLEETQITATHAETAANGKPVSALSAKPPASTTRVIALLSTGENGADEY